MTEKKSINYAFKFLYAIGMILVVAGHCSNGGVSIFYDWFTPYAFHLPLFIFASGYFYKKNDINNCTKSIWNKIKKLIIPFYLWNFVYAIIIQILHHLGFQFGDPISFHSLIIAPLINGHQYALNCPSWFVAPLFYIYLLNLIIRKLLKHANDWIFFILFLVFGMCGIKLAMLGYTHGWWLALTQIFSHASFLWSWHIISLKTGGKRYALSFYLLYYRIISSASFNYKMRRHKGLRICMV